MKRYSSKLRSKGRITALILGICIMAAVAVGVSSCKAWRTISTTATYTQQNDSTTGKASATITTKTVEEYQGVKKN